MLCLVPLLVGLLVVGGGEALLGRNIGVSWGLFLLFKFEFYWLYVDCLELVDGHL